MYRLWAEMVWAEMVMGRNGHGPKWLWAEMTSDRLALWKLVWPGLSNPRPLAPKFELQKQSESNA